MQKNLRAVVIIIILAILIGVGVLIFRPSATVSAPSPGPAAGGPPPGMPVKAAQVRTGTVDVEVSAVGTLLANESVMVRPEIAGRVVNIHFNEGQQVKTGSVLVTIDPAEYQAQLAASSADTKLNTQRYERAEELFRKGFISQQALDEARGNLSMSSSRQKEFQARLGKTSIKAPFGGIIGLRAISPGAYVEAGQDIARLDNIESMKLDFRVPEIYLAKIGKGQSVHVKVDAYPEQEFAGSVYAIEPAVDDQTRTALLRARIPNDGGKLRPGMFARVRLVLESRADSLLVPEQAIVPKGQDSFVYRIVEGKALFTKVQLGHRSVGEVEVVSGLSAQDTVVTDGQIKLRDGAPVMPQADDGQKGGGGEAGGAPPAAKSQGSH